MANSTTWYLYILLCNNGSYYTGVTTNLANRFSAHLKGKGGAYTRSHPPQKIIYTEKFPDRSSALKREVAIKNLSRIQKQHLVK